jgi:iron(II)-dependent oxidoreductase
MRATEAEPADGGFSVIAALREARHRTLELVADLSDEQLLGPRMAIVNPLLWEIGHLAWFDEHWLLRHLRGLPPLLEQGDSLYDSARVAHDTRWDLPLPSRAATLAYMRRVLDRIEEEHERNRGKPARQVEGYDELYFLHLALFHEYMHTEAFAYTRQTLGYPAPCISSVGPVSSRQSVDFRVEKLGDVEISGGTFQLGTAPGGPFVFDNEQWAHAVTVKPFRMARAAVTNAEFAAFVDGGGYGRREFWTDDGWQWRENAGAEHPVYWRREGNGRWLRRNFDQWLPLEPELPVLHVNWYEATAFCRWAKRRLPTEPEWEMAASCEPDPNGHGVIASGRVYPWGNDSPSPERANLDFMALGCLPAAGLPASESAFGARQMIGNTWEWTADGFGPYPGFSPGPYREYSAPWFGDHKVLRGGCWATRSLMIRNTYRNFYKPDRRDVWAGFRTCAP